MNKNSTTFLTILFFMLVNFYLPAQDYFELPLYNNGNITNEEEPSIRVYPAEAPNGSAVMACPGGGYSYLEMNKEGYAFAPWFIQRGITFIVLKYRLPEGNPEIPLADAKQAIRLMREHAETWNINPRKIGIMGSSAGGHVASTLSTHYDSATRPDFQILLYPVITMESKYTHTGSREKLLGKKPSKKLIKLYSNENRVTPDAPPAFIVLSDNDNIVPSENSIRYYQALNKNKISAEMHIYPTGGHGWGMHENYTYYSQWTKALEKWLENIISK